MFSSVFSRFSACHSSLVKLLSGREADCIVEAILLLSDCHYEQQSPLNHCQQLPAPYKRLILLTIY